MPDTSNARPPAIQVWDLGVRLFHWLLVSAIALAFLSSEEESVLWSWHIPIGWCAALLIAFRLVWGFVGGEHARFANFLKPAALPAHLRHLISGKLKPSVGHNPVGGVAVVALLGLVSATVVSGAAGGEDAHEAIAYALLALVAVHITAVLLVSYLSKDNLIAAMLTGSKRAARHPDALDAIPPARLAVPVTFVAVLLTAFGVTIVDRNAFAPHSSQPSTATEERGQDTDEDRTIERYGD